MSELFLKLLNMSITAGWLVIAVVVLRLVLKKAPKWVNCVLWALVAVRLICPFSFESDISLVPEQVGSGELVSEWADDYVDDVWTIPDTSIYYDAAVFNGREPIYAGDGHYYVVAKYDQLGEPATVKDTVVPVLTAIWLAGVAVLLLHALISYLRLRRRVSAAMHAGNKVWLCDAVESPFILGFFRPRIYLPSSINEEDVEHVLAHERAHLQRCDHWWKPLGYVLLAVYWFNPLIWVAYILLCRDIELACDEKVIKRPDTDRKAYSEALLACSVKRSAITACPLAFGEVSVRGRIKSVLNYKKPAFWIILVALVACIVAALCFLTDPVKHSEVEPFGKSYRVVETTYVDGSYSFVMTPENAPKFRVDESKNLIEIYVEGSDRTDTYLGALEPTELTKENFDEWFHPITSETGMWENGLSAEKIRRENLSAWELTQNRDGSHCRLLLQKSGDLYLTYGILETDQGEKRIRWLLKLEQTEDTGAINGGDAPMSDTFVTSEVDESNPALETAIDYVTKRMETFNESWKTIAPGNSTTRGKITALECVSTTAMENIRLDLYRLEYRMLLNGNPAAVEVGGMSHEEIDGEIWLTEWESSGQPYILHYSAMEDGQIDWKTICMTSTEEIGVIYAENKDMETMLGLDKYTIAIHKLYELYLKKEYLEEEIADRSVVGAMLAAVEALMTKQLPATISMEGPGLRKHPVMGSVDHIFDAWDSINGRQSCSGILNHTYQVVDSIETSNALITLEFAVNGVDWGLTFYDGTDTLSVYTGGAEYLLRATPKQEDVFLSPLGSLIRRWYDEAEYMALDGYDGKTIVIPNTGQSYLEAAKAWCEAYESIHLIASSGSKECYSYVSCRVEPAEPATDLRREQGEIDENTYAFYAYTAFVPENEQALNWSMAGNTGAYEGNDPNVPKEAYEYTRCGYITREEDGWHGTIVGTGW